MRARFTRTSSGLTRTHTISAGVGTGNSNKRVATRIESAINMSNTLAGGNVNIAQHGGTPTFMGMMQGLAPETSPGQMAQLYRDCYYNDSIAGSTVDMSAMFPFSDYTLTGLSTAEIDLYEASLARLNMRSLMSEIGATYLADGAFIGSLVFDSDARTFQDVLVHDTAQAEISMQPLHTMDPVIKVNTANSLQNFFNSNSPYIEQMLSGYPRALIEGFMDGPTHLDPLSTLFIPRRGLQDRTHNSYLHRLIPIFLLEKVLYRGTLLELSRRQRSTTHVKMGDENWIPTDEELQSGLAEFQMTEYDPLGAWIATRQGIEINEIRSHSEFFKWTDIVETLVPLKLRALSISEAFLSGDASYSTAESAVNSFTDSMLSFRQLLTYKTFYSKVFPLIAVLNNLYKDTDKANVETDTIAQVRRNLADISNLKIPTIQWHKSLEGKDSESQFDMLERLSEKGFVVPLRMWASAAGLDMSALMRDLAEDSDLKSKMEKLTGKRAETIGNEDKKGFDDDAFLGEGEAPTGEGSGAAGGADAQFQASINKTIASVTRPLSVAGGRARVPILARDMTHLDLPRNGKLSKSGNAVHAQYGDHRQDRIMNDKLIKALRALRDPEHAAKVRARRQEIGATGPSIVPPGTFPAP